MKSFPQWGLSQTRKALKHTSKPYHTVRAETTMASLENQRIRASKLRVISPGHCFQLQCVIHNVCFHICALDSSPCCQIRRLMRESFLETIPKSGPEHAKLMTVQCVPWLPHAFHSFSLFLLVPHSFTHIVAEFPCSSDEWVGQFIGLISWVEGAPANWLGRRGESYAAKKYFPIPPLLWAWGCASCFVFDWFRSSIDSSSSFVPRTPSATI